MVKDILGQQRWSVTSGVSKFVKELSDFTSDCHQLPHWFTNSVLMPLVEAKRVNLKDVKWLQDAEDIYSLGGHYQMLAYMLKYKEQQLGSISQA